MYIMTVISRGPAYFALESVLIKFFFVNSDKLIIVNIIRVIDEGCVDHPQSYNYRFYMGWFPQ